MRTIIFCSFEHYPYLCPKRLIIKRMKNLFLLLLCMLSVSVYADDNSPDPDPTDPDGWGKPHKAPTLTPQMSYDAPYLYIVSPSAINDAEIIIRDIDGNIIYDESVRIPAISYVIVLPENICSDLYSVTLIFDGQNYILYNTL